VTYAALTYADPNPLKRWLQAQRIEAAIRLTPPDARRVIDYGAGDGVAAARLLDRRPELAVICFEPSPALRAEAAACAAARPGMRLVGAEAELPAGWADVVLCLEVFEHLPEPETEAALGAIERVLRPGGLLVMGVPHELGPVAAAKGLFRRGRRAEAFDARTRGILGAAVGRPPVDRPVVEIAPGRAYHPHHLGFDHRGLVRAVRRRFRLEERTGTPFGRLLPLLNTELYIRAQKP